MENLSANLDSNLKLGSKTVDRAQLSGFNDLGGQSQKANYQRQSSQLHTPEVSSMSVDNSIGMTTRSSAKKSNPNN